MANEPGLWKTAIAQDDSGSPNFNSEGEMDKKNEKCGCIKNEDRELCKGCGEWDIPGYWCDVCNREVAEKRCPFCGLKARRIKETQEGK